MNILSRKFEFQAGERASQFPQDSLTPPSKTSELISRIDEFAVKLGYSAELARSLIKLQIQNLSTMDADWMYASYHFSHPILPERLGALGWKGPPAENGKAADSEKPVKAADREL